MGLSKISSLFVLFCISPPFCTLIVLFFSYLSSFLFIYVDHVFVLLVFTQNWRNVIDQYSPCNFFPLNIYSFYSLLIKDQSFMLEAPRAGIYIIDLFSSLCQYFSSHESTFFHLFLISLLSRRICRRCGHSHTHTHSHSNHVSQHTLLWYYGTEWF